MNLMVDMKENRYDPQMIVGGQIWLVDKNININRVKNLLNIIGKIKSKVLKYDKIFSTNDSNPK